MRDIRMNKMFIMIYSAVRTFLRASSRRSAKSHARRTDCHAASVSGFPDVVVAVTSTLIMTAAGKTPDRSTFVGSWNINLMNKEHDEIAPGCELTSSLARIRTDRMNIAGSTTSCSSSGNFGA